MRGKIKIDYYNNQIFLTLSSILSGTNNFLFFGSSEFAKSMYVRLSKKRKLTGKKLYIPGVALFDYVVSRSFAFQENDVTR